MALLANFIYCPPILKSKKFLDEELNYNQLDPIYKYIIRSNHNYDMAIRGLVYEAKLRVKEFVSNRAEVLKREFESKY